MGFRSRLSSLGTSIRTTLTPDFLLNSLQYLSFGLMLTAIEDESVGNGNSVNNIALGITSSALWLISSGLQLRNAYREPGDEKLCSSTRLVRKSLGHMTGKGIANTLVHMITKRDTADAQMGNFIAALGYKSAMSIFDPKENEPILQSHTTPSNSEIVEIARYIAEILIDIVTGIGVESLPLMAYQQPWSLKTEIVLPIALFLQAAQVYYNAKYDPVNTQTSIMKAARQLNFSTFFQIVQATDAYINAQRNEYSSLNMTYQALSAFVTFGVSLGLRVAARNSSYALNIQQVDEELGHAFAPLPTGETPTPIVDAEPPSHLPSAMMRP